MSKVPRSDCCISTVTEVAPPSISSVYYYRCDSCGKGCNVVMVSDIPTTTTIQRDWLNKLLEEAYTITAKLECGENIKVWETARLVGYIQSAQFLLDKQSVNNAH